jgi:hypothetical protein
MSMIPAPPSALIQSGLLRQTVTIPLTDLYDLLTRKGLTMTEPKTRGTKRGYRRVSMMLPLAEYTRLSAMAEMQTRTPDQQALFLLRQMLVPKQGPSLVDELDGLLPDELPDEDDAVPEPLER